MRPGSAQPRRAIRIGDFWLQVAFGGCLLAGWEWAYSQTKSIWISAPSAIVDRILVWHGTHLYTHLGTTLVELFSGLAIGVVAGAVLGMALGRAGVVAQILRPIVVAIYSVPLIALSPLFIMFFGMEMMPKIVLVALVVFFLVFFTTFSGAEAIDEDLIATADLMGANSLERFLKVVAPACTAWIVAGLSVALPYALVATITGEMLAARAGMGFLLNQSATQFDVTGVYSILLILMMLGLVFSEGMSHIEKWLLRWR